jgi:hypothetical protein
MRHIRVSGELYKACGAGLWAVSSYAHIYFGEDEHFGRFSRVIVSQAQNWNMLKPHLQSV